MEHKLVFSEDGADIVAGIELRNGKANASGWSTYEVWYIKDVGAFAPLEMHIADLYCGEVRNLKEGYASRVE